MIIVCVLCCTSRAASAVGCWRPYDHLGHCCWSKLVPNLILKLCQSLTNFYPNLTTFSKNNTLVIPTGGLTSSGSIVHRKSGSVTARIGLYVESDLTTILAGA